MSRERFSISQSLRGQNYKSQLSKQAIEDTQFYYFAARIIFAERCKLVAESCEFHLTLSRAHRAHFSQLEIHKKAGHFKLKAGKRDRAKKA